MAAGEWGHYNCDLPPKTLANMLTFIKDEIKPDMFICTGDNSAHNVWDNTYDEVIKYTKNITDTMIEIFEGSDITVFPIQGNHDVWPINEQDFTKARSNIAINSYKKFWETWLEPETLVKYEEYGYYS